MKKVVKIISAALACVMMASVLLCSCNKTGDSAITTRYANYDLTQYVKLGQYKNVEVDPYAYELTEEVVQQQIQMALANYAQNQEKEDAVAMGDQVNIDFTGYMNGETFTGGSSQAYTLSIGSGSFIAGFEEGLVGAKAGDTVTLDLFFPDPYPNNPDLAGKPVQFEVKINAVYTQILPEYTDAFVSQYYGYATIAEFEIALRESIAAQYESNKRYYYMSAMWEKIKENTEFLAYPEAEYNQIYDNYVSYYTKAAANASMTLSEFLAVSEDMTESEFYTWIDEEVKNAMNEELIMYCIASVENISLSDQEYKEKLNQYVEQMGYSSAEELLAMYSQEDVVQSALFDKIFEFLLDTIVIKGTVQ